MRVSPVCLAAEWMPRASIARPPGRRNGEDAVFTPVRERRRVRRPSLRPAPPARRRAPAPCRSCRPPPPLVRAVALHPREAQRQAAGVLRARLQVVEGDLDDQLGPHVHGVAVAAGLAREQLARLPGEQLVGHALEGLAEHHEAAGRGIARAEVQVRQPALAPAVAPLGGEHDEVERVRALDLEPARAAAAGLVGRVERLRHHALVAARERVGVEGLGGGDVGGDEARDHERRRQRRGERGEALAAPAGRAATSPSRCRQSKKNDRERQLGAQSRDVELAAEAAHRHLERRGAPSARERDRLAVEDQLARRQRRSASTISGTAAVTSFSARV